MMTSSSSSLEMVMVAIPPASAQTLPQKRPDAAKRGARRGRALGCGWGGSQVGGG